MKKLQRFGVFMLCGALALSFVACGPEGGGGVTSDSTPIEQVDDIVQDGFRSLKRRLRKGQSSVSNILRAAMETNG